jgi:ATP-binding cassette subfamily B (MDR/TAP) protein 1
MAPLLGKPSFFSLFRYATRTDLIVIFISAICAVISGAALPLMTVVYGSLSGSFGDFTNNPKAAIAAFHHKIDNLTLDLVYIAIGQFVSTYIATVGFIWTGEIISARIRENYLRSVLRQEIGYFDQIGAGLITTQISVHTYLVQEGISQKIALALTAVSTFLGAFVIGFIKYWKLTLVLTSAIVAIALTTYFLSTFLVKFYKDALASYTQGGAVAEDVLGSIRNTTAFGNQEKVATKYDTYLIEAEKAGFKSKAITGSLMGILLCYTYLTYSLAFWLGGQYMVDGQLTLSAFLTITQSIIIGAFALGNIAPNFQAFNTAVAGARALYATIDRRSPLDPEAEDGEKLENFEATIELRNVSHVYPTRPDVLVMEDANLRIPARKTTAIVGASGSGKSTVIALLERFYDPTAGEVLLDGRNIQELNLRWLRQQFSLVSQEPTLFATTVAANIEQGLIGTANEHLSKKEIRALVEKAAKAANAHDFITQLPKGYEADVGQRGSLLSVGQKQRIAIARAVIRNPKILLLDEATSALDTLSEEMVQAALDKAAEGRTTIIVAHRLSTIKRADNIVVMSRGRIVEQGVHDDLINQGGTYYKLVEAQKTLQRQEEETGQRIREGDYGRGSYMSNLTFENDDGIPFDVDNPDEFGKKAVGLNNDHPYGHEGNIELAPLETPASNRKEKAKQPTYSLRSLIRLLASLNRPEWPFMLLGLFSSVITGGGQPVQSVLYSKSLAALSLPSILESQLRSETTFWSWMFFMLALVQLIFSCVQGISFALCSERLIHRSRDKAFRALLCQDIQYFDKAENNTGALSAFLSTETTNLAGISGVVLGTIIQVLVTLIASYVIALVIGWKMALVCITTVPVLLGCGFLRVWMLGRFQYRHHDAAQISAAYASEATTAIQTVASLTLERNVLDHYHDMLAAQGAKSLQSTLKSAVLYAASQALVLLSMALGLWYGSKLIANREYSIFQFFLCYSSVIFGSQSAGTVMSFAPDITKARHAASQLKKLFDSKPEIDSLSSHGGAINDVQGSIEFRNVRFRYPSRPDVPVLRGLNMSIQAGQNVALVGPSGCGKSTIIALLERFYDPDAGSIYVDGLKTSLLNIASFRKHLALVSQEPTLYQGTIRENILLGLGDSFGTASEEAIIQACRDANIYDFIQSLPQGFNTIVGSKGSTLSGGQKQRIAVARALLRNPKILLLDEATSALDSESEKVVQAALDAAAKGRTTISVAHRLNTVQKADVIFVLDRGQIIEKGTHEELLDRKGKYHELVSLQSLGKNL